MSEPAVAAEECVALGATNLAFEKHTSRDRSIGSLPVTRALPIRDRRMVGPWCFLDRFGPMTFTEDRPMDIAPHPHIGLQTVTWLLEGEVLHDDSLGCEAIVRPGGVNVMTAGRGIAHAEQTPTRNSGRLNGVQLWVALPDAHRSVDPTFEGIQEVPVVEAPGGTIRVFAGSLGGVQSPGTYYTKIVGADIQVHAGETLEVDLGADDEHAVMVLDGDASIENERLEERALYYLGVRRSGISLRSHAGGRVLLIGGPPFPETILIWWNFVARKREEIEEARTDWEEHRRFGTVIGYRGPRLAAPDLGRFARPNPVS